MHVGLLTWINPLVSVSKGERYVPAIAVKSSVLKTFTQVSVKVNYQVFLKEFNYILTYLATKTSIPSSIQGILSLIAKLSLQNV